MQLSSLILIVALLGNLDDEDLAITNAKIL